MKQQILHSSVTTIKNEGKLVKVSTKSECMKPEENPLDISYCFSSVDACAKGISAQVRNTISHYLRKGHSFTLTILDIKEEDK